MWLVKNNCYAVKLQVNVLMLSVELAFICQPAVSLSVVDYQEAWYTIRAVELFCEFVCWLVG